MRVFLEGHTGSRAVQLPEPGRGQGGEAEAAALISATFGVSLFSSCELGSVAGWRRRDNGDKPHVTGRNL